MTHPNSRSYREYREGAKHELCPFTYAHPPHNINIKNLVEGTRSTVYCGGILPNKREIPRDVPDGTTMEIKWNYRTLQEQVRLFVERYELSEYMKGRTPMPHPVAGETWLANGDTSECEILGYDEKSGDTWVRWKNTGETKVYKRDRWERYWTKKPPFTPPTMPNMVALVYPIGSNFELKPTATIPCLDNDHFRSRLAHFMSTGSRYKVWMLTITRLGAVRWQEYTREEYLDDFDDN